MNSNLEELESLLAEWDSGTLEDKGIERVREILRSSEEARNHYLQHQLLNAAFKLHFDSGVDTPKPTPFAGEPVTQPSTSIAFPVRKTGMNLWWAAAALLLVGLLVGRLVYLELEDNDVNAKSENPQSNIANLAPKPNEPTSEGVAIVTQLVNVTWADSQKSMDVGDALPIGKFGIQSGFVQVEFFCGATVVIEGPAELDIRSPMLARVAKGKLRAQVPPAARGFTLEADDLKVVDLGTEFGMTVSPGSSNVHVFDGEVELIQGDSKEKQRLTAGDAVSQVNDGTLKPVGIEPDQFMGIATLESQVKGARDRRLEKWRQWSSQLQTEPDLIAFYSFEPLGGTRRLKCDASNQQQAAELDGAIVGAKWVDGRWPKSGALEFKRPGDRVRVNIPGEFSSLTFSCWVKIDSLDRWYNSLFLTDNYNQGEPHWQILDTGQLFFSVRFKADDVQGAAARKKTHDAIISPKFWKPSLSGRWLHLATTYDSVQGRVTHYLNGKLLHTDLIDQQLVVKKTRIGAASIGNWSIPTRPEERFAVRNLNGSIGEFAIFADCLTAVEIKEIYLNGKP